MRFSPEPNPFDITHRGRGTAWAKLLQRAQMFPRPSFRARTRYCWQAWLVAALVQVLSPAHAAISVHAVLDRFGSATSFVNADGQLWAWGSNAQGQYGDGTRHSVITAKPLPYPTGVTNWTRFVPGARFLALDQTGRLFAWGEPEVSNTTGKDFLISLPQLLGNQKWQDVVPPAIDNRTDPLPFGLGVDLTGRLWWLRMPPPASPLNASFSEFHTVAAGGAGFPTDFVSVAGSSRGFLALTASGRVFAAAVPNTGLRGIHASHVGAGFSPDFFEIDPPAPGVRWTRIALAADLGVAWGDDGIAYTWGDYAPGLFEPQIDANPTAVPPFPGVNSWLEVSGGGRGILMSLDDQGRLHGGGPAAPIWSAHFGASREFTVNAARLQIPSNWVPVQSFSESGRHLLILGSDGQVHAMGYDEDFQLGQAQDPNDVEVFPPVIPAGFADFLSGDRADLPELSFEVSDDLLVEPRSAAVFDGHSAQISLKVKGPVAGFVFYKYQVSTRLTNGLPNPDLTATNLAQVGYLASMGAVDNFTKSFDYEVRPVFNDFQDTPLLYDITLLPGLNYYLGEHTRATLRYQPTAPVNHPPRVRVAWPPPNTRVYYYDTIDVVLEVWDPDGYIASAGMAPLFSSGPRIVWTGAITSKVPGATNLVHILAKPFVFSELQLFPDIQVTDDRGLTTRLPSGNSFMIPIRSFIGHPLAVSVGNRTLALTFPATTGPLELQSSADLQNWTLESKYSIPDHAPGDFPVHLDPAPGESRFYRLINPEHP